MEEVRNFVLTANALSELVTLMNDNNITKDNIIKIGNTNGGRAYYVIYEKSTTHELKTRGLAKAQVD